MKKRFAFLSIIGLLQYLGPKETAEQWQIDGQKLTKTVKETGILELIKAQKQ